MFCGAAIVHNVFIWQKEKTICVRKSAVMAAAANTSSGLLGNHSLLTPITPPMQFLNHHQQAQHHSGNNNAGNALNSSIATPTSTNLLLNHVHLGNGSLPNGNANHTPLPHTPVTPITPLSANHSHLGFNHASILASYGLRPAAATPPPLKLGSGRDATGSVSPGNLDISTATTSNSQHELSTLV